MFSVVSLIIKTAFLIDSEVSKKQIQRKCWRKLVAEKSNARRTSVGPGLDQSLERLFQGHPGGDFDDLSTHSSVCLLWCLLFVSGDCLWLPRVVHSIGIMRGTWAAQTWGTPTQYVTSLIQQLDNNESSYSSSKFSHKPDSSFLSWVESAHPKLGVPFTPSKRIRRWRSERIRSEPFWPTACLYSVT